MAKKTKKTPAIKLQSFDDVDFKKAPDLSAAKKVINPQYKREFKDFVKEEIINPVEPAVDRVVEQAPVESPKEEVAPITRAEASTPAPVRNLRSSKKSSSTKSVKGTFPPTNKKRASFNIDADLHRALKEYSFFEEIEMVEYIFEHLVRPDLAKKGYYPPKKRRR